MEDRTLDAIEEEDNRCIEIENEEEQRMAKLDQEWTKVVEDIHKKLKEFVAMLTGRDSKRALELRLENKAVFLYSIMGNYNQSEALRIRDMADYISKQTKKLAELQASAAK